jgi:preprotein translocase subunit SecE
MAETQETLRLEEGEGMAKINPGEFMRQVQAEARKVVWPTRQETVTTAIFVAIMMVLLAVFFLGIDSAFGALVRWLLTLA